MLYANAPEVLGVRNTMPTLPEVPGNFHCKKFLELEKNNSIIVFLKTRAFQVGVTHFIFAVRDNS